MRQMLLLLLLLDGISYALCDLSDCYSLAHCAFLNDKAQTAGLTDMVISVGSDGKFTDFGNFTGKAFSTNSKILWQISPELDKLAVAYDGWQRAKAGEIIGYASGAVSKKIADPFNARTDYVFYAERKAQTTIIEGAEGGSLSCEVTYGYACPYLATDGFYIDVQSSTDRVKDGLEYNFYSDCDCRNGWHITDGRIQFYNIADKGRQISGADQGMSSSAFNGMFSKCTSKGCFTSMQFGVNDVTNSAYGDLLGWRHQVVTAVDTCTVSITGTWSAQKYGSALQAAVNNTFQSTREKSSELSSVCCNSGTHYLYDVAGIKAQAYQPGSTGPDNAPGSLEVQIKCNKATPETSGKCTGKSGAISNIVSSTLSLIPVVGGTLAAITSTICAAINLA